jgi:hypothetical protein
MLLTVLFELQVQMNWRGKPVAKYGKEDWDTFA